MGRYKILMIVVIVLIVIVSIGFIILNSTTIYKGVFVEEVELSGLTRYEALDYLQRKKNNEIETMNLGLVYDGMRYTLGYNEIGVTYDYLKAVSQSYQLGREGHLLRRMKDIFNARFRGYPIKMDRKYDPEKLNYKIATISKSIDEEGKDASIQYADGQFTITPEVMGRKVDTELLKRKVIDALFRDQQVSIPVGDKQPRVTGKLLTEIKDLLGSFGTSYGGSSGGRVHNITLSVKAIDGTVLLPGETFSFNNTTGVRDTRAGYREAKVILNGEFVDATGGGVCQVSTTLYNAILLSDLKIIERYPHSIPSSYVSKGQDATVAYDYLDLKFKNDSTSPIYIYGTAKNSTLTIKVFGNKRDMKKEIRIKSVIVETIQPETETKVDENLPPGEKIILQKGRYGYRTKTYKITYINGKETNRELITTDFYKPQKYIIKVGPPRDEPQVEDDNSSMVP